MARGEGKIAAGSAGRGAVKADRDPTLIVLVGVSGAGKDTLIKRMADRVPFRKPISATTRAPREGERNGVDYHFLAREDFERRIANDELFEHEEFSGNIYGTLCSELSGGDLRLCIRENKGARRMQRELGAVVVGVVPPSSEVVIERLRARGDSEEDIAKRLEADKEREAEIRSFADYVIVNDDLERATDEFADLLTGLEQEAANRIIAIDFDGTAYPLIDALASLPETPLLNGKRLSREDVVSWQTMVDLYGGFEQMCIEMDKARTLEVMRSTGLYPGFAEAVAALRRAGIKPVIVSHNNSGSIDNIREYLRELGLHLEVVSAEPSEKIAWCEKHDVKVLVDDAPDTIRKAKAAGLIPASLRYRYNSEAISEVGAIVATSWEILLPQLISAYEPTVEQAHEQELIAVA